VTAKPTPQGEDWRARVFDVAPYVAATAAFGAGLLTLVAVATPALPHVRGLDAIDLHR